MSCPILVLQRTLQGEFFGFHLGNLVRPVTDPVIIPTENIVLSAAEKYIEE